MNRTPLPRPLSRLFVLLAAALAVSGLAQMPLFKRYYLADIPGLAWLNDFYFTHMMHYVAAALLLALLGYVAARWLREWSHGLRLTASGRVRVALVLALVLTGAVRMYKNQPGVAMEPFTVMIVDWTHLGLALLLGVAAVAARLAGRSAYAEPR
ncbi:MAG: 4Fe-4S ferredoxin [Desulfovibrio sp.]